MKSEEVDFIKSLKWDAEPLPIKSIRKKRRASFSFNTRLWVNNRSPLSIFHGECGENEDDSNMENMEQMSSGFPRGLGMMSKRIIAASRLQYASRLTDLAIEKQLADGYVEEGTRAEITMRRLLRGEKYLELRMLFSGQFLHTARIDFAETGEAEMRSADGTPVAATAYAVLAMMNKLLRNESFRDEVCLNKDCVQCNLATAISYGVMWLKLVHF